MANVEKFEETKSKNGWKLKITKHNSVFITTALYDARGIYCETKSFNLQNNNDLVFFKKYIELFEDDPAKNIKSMLKMIIRN